MVSETEEGRHGDTFTSQKHFADVAGSALVVLGSPTSEARTVTGDDIIDTFAVFQRIVTRARGTVIFGGAVASHTAGVTSCVWSETLLFE